MCKIYHKGESLEGGFYEKRGLAAALAMLTMATTGTAFAATNFDVWLYRVDEGYNASVATKSIATDHAYIRVKTSSNPNVSTNYLVTKTSNGAQMTTGAFIIPNNDHGRKSNPYKAAYQNYAGNCTLRVNTGTVIPNYRVTGEWNPNG